MPRDSQGAYSLPPGYRAVTGQKVEASQHNPPLEDLAASMTASLPRNGAAPMLGNLPMGGFKATNMAAGTASTDGVNKSQLDGVVPVGSVIDFAGATAPVGWLFCYGQAVSRATYSALYSAIGTTYGSGDGSTTFNLPDCRGRVTAGKDDMGGTSANRLTDQAGGLNGDTLGDVGGEEAHTLTISEIPSHAHSSGTLATSSAGAHAHSIPSGNDSSVGGTVPYLSISAMNDTATTSLSGAHTHDITGNTGNNGTGGAHNNVQPTIILNKIIRSGV